MHLPPSKQPGKRHTRHPILRARAGTGITEYVLLGSTVAVVAFGGLTLMGNSLNNVFQNMLSFNHSTPQVTASTSVQTATGKKSGAAFSPSVTGAAKSNTTALTETAPLPAPVVITQIAGISGDTEAKVQAMITIAQKELAKGTIDQSQYDLIMHLANKGHEIATLEGVLDNAYATNNTNGQIMYNGQSYTMTELNALFSRTVNDYKPLESKMRGFRIGSLISASADISYLASSISQTGNGSAAQAAKLSSTNASGETHKQSARICAAGQHTDVNNQCIN